MSEGKGREWIGLLVGVITFLGGVVLLMFTFQLAFQLFSTSPGDALQIKDKAPLDPNLIGKSAFGLLARIGGILMMCIVGSVISNRGIRLYQAAIGEPITKPSKKSKIIQELSETRAEPDSSEK